MNNEHEKYKDEVLYVFGKDVELDNKIGEGQTNVSLYIKVNKLANQYVYVVSLHEQEHQLFFPFK